MTPVTAYKALLRELDKFGSPDFTKSDFNYFFNKTVRDTLESLAKQAEVSEVANKAVSPYLKLGAALTGLADVYDLPKGYGIIKAVFATSAVTSDEAKRLTSTTKGYTLKNWFLRPSAHRFYFEEAEGKLTVYGTGISAVKLDYYRLPEACDLIASPDAALDMNQEFYDEAVSATTRVFLENVSDQRYQSQLQESQIRNL